MTLKLIQSFISHVTISETEIELFQIISATPKTLENIHELQ